MVPRLEWLPEFREFGCACTIMRARAHVEGQPKFLTSNGTKNSNLVFGFSYMLCYIDRYTLCLYTYVSRKAKHLMIIKI